LKAMKPHVVIKDDKFEAITIATEVSLTPNFCSTTLGSYRSSENDGKSVHVLGSLPLVLAI
jgi:hypothetical protein